MVRLVRSLGVLAVALALAASSSSRNPPPPAPVAMAIPQPPLPQAMEPRNAHGLWKSSFGAVKIEADGPGRVHGVWTYQRQGRQVVGYFAGALEGNVLRFTWREPAQPQAGEPLLAGDGWLAFDPTGGGFRGRWWSQRREREGEWTGWRQPAAAPEPPR